MKNAVGAPAPRGANRSWILSGRRADQSQRTRQPRRAGLIALSAAVCVSTCVLPGPALAAWSKPERLSTLGGSAFGADLTSNGTLMLEWQGTPFASPGQLRTGFVIARPGAAPSAIAPSPLAKSLPNNNNRSVYQLGFLNDGRVVRCWTTPAPAPRQVIAGIYSRTGALTRKVKLATLGSWIEDGSGFATCRVAVSGDNAVVAWAPEAAGGATAPANFQGVVYLSRVSSSGSFSEPLAVPVATNQLQSTEATWLSSLTLTPGGWIGLGWMYENWIDRQIRHLACSYSANLTWLSPNDQPTSTFNLISLRESNDLAACGGPPEPTLGAVGANSALVVYQGARLESELITTSGSTQVEHAIDPGAFPGGVRAPDIVSGGAKVVVVGGGFYVTKRRYVPIRAEEWYAGRWHKPQVVAGTFPTPAGFHSPVHAYPAPAAVFVNARGQAAIVCSAVDNVGFFGGYYGSFDF
jgi:hypothetical protein